MGEKKMEQPEEEFQAIPEPIPRVEGKNEQQQYQVVYRIVDKTEQDQAGSLTPKYSSVPDHIKPNVDQNVLQLLTKRTMLVHGKGFVGNISDPNDKHTPLLCFYCFASQESQPVSFLICLIV